MTEPTPVLRDARLHQALAHAPDAQDLPGDAMRVAILKAANKSISTVAMSTILPQIPWWRSLWAQTGRRGGPWNAAFATVLLGTIITLIWFEREVPDARPDEGPVVAQKPPASPSGMAEDILNKNEVIAEPSAGSGPAAPTGQVQNPGDAQAVAPAAPQVRAAPKPGPDAPAVSSAKTLERLPLPPQSSVAPVPAMRSESTATERQTMPGLGNASRDKAVGEIASLQKKAESSAAAAQAPAPAVAATQPAAKMAAPPAAAPAPLAAGAAAMPRAPALADRAKVGSGPAAINAPADWTQAEVAYLGRVVRLARADAQSLVDRLLALLATNPPGGVDAAAGVPLLRVQLMDASGTLAQIELWNSAYKWRRVGQADVMGPVSSQGVESLLAEVNRSLPP